jgi:hypothetical protein
MNRTLNTEMMTTVRSQLSKTSDPLTRHALFEALYQHTIIEAVLTEDIDSLPESTCHRSWTK